MPIERGVKWPAEAKAVDEISDTSAWAALSPCERYRYSLGRVIDLEREDKTVAFMMLNPSTADAFKDDATIRRCRGFARTFGFGVLEVVNLFPLRSKDPKELLKHGEPFGPPGVNDTYVKEAARRAKAIILAWGAHGNLHGASERYVKMLNQGATHDKLWVLGETQHGLPKHPLYLPGNAILERPSWWRERQKT